MNYAKRFNNRVGASLTIITGSQAHLWRRMRLRQGVRWMPMFRTRKEYPIVRARYPHW
jgi:hypothetical protein